MDFKFTVAQHICRSRTVGHPFNTIIVHRSIIFQDLLSNRCTRNDTTKRSHIVNEANELMSELNFGCGWRPCGVGITAWSIRMGGAWRNEYSHTLNHS